MTSSNAMSSVAMAVLKSLQENLEFYSPANELG